MVRYKPVKRDLHKKVENFMYQNPKKLALAPRLVRSD